VRSETVTDARRSYNAAAPASYPLEGQIEDTDLASPGPHRLIRSRPAGTTSSIAAVIYAPGGGWVLGDAESHLNISHKLADLLACDVFTIGYRRAPEHKFPAAFNDVQQSIQTLTTALPKPALAIVGDSAGANLVAAATRHARRVRPEPIVGTVLIYPALHAACGLRDNLSSNDELLTAHQYEAYLDAYTSTEDRNDPRFDAFADHQTISRRPTHVVTVASDPLKPQQHTYIELLRSLDIDVTHTLIPDAPHGFLRYPDRYPAATAALGDIASTIRRWFNHPKAVPPWS